MAFKRTRSNGIAGEFYVAAELTRRGMIATLTGKNTGDVDILAMNPITGKQIAIQVKEKSTGNLAFTVTKNEESINRQKLLNIWYVCVDLANSYNCYIANPAQIFDNALKEEKKYLSTPKKNGEPKKPSPALYFVPERDLKDDNGSTKVNNWEDLPIFAF